MMPIRIAPFTFLIERITIIRVPTIASNAPKIDGVLFLHNNHRNIFSVTDEAIMPTTHVTMAAKKLV